MIGIIDYGLGNVQSFIDIFKKLNVPVMAAQCADDLARAERFVLPGVGAFDWAMERLDASGMRLILNELVIEQKRPVLGVCVGMHMMADSSEEGEGAGLGWLNAEVKRFDEKMLGEKACLPHMGWNDVEPLNTDCLFLGMQSPRFYFLHSYYFSPKASDVVLANTDYGQVFASAVRSGNVWGTQFHPEKSHQWGVRLLKNFSEI